jgi:hypothetical protein
MGFFLFATTSGPPLGPTQPPIQWVPVPLTPGVKQPGHEADHPQLRMHGAVPSLLQYIFMAWCLIKQEMHFHSVMLS